MAYTDLSDEDKVRTAINFVAEGHPLPKELREFLESEGLYDAIVYPQEYTKYDNQYDSAAY